MKDLFSPDRTGVGGPPADSDVSMDEASNASAAPGGFQESSSSMAIGSPPLAQRRTRRSPFPGTGGPNQGVRSRLFADEAADGKPPHKAGNQHHQLHHKPTPSMILKPLDLNKEFEFAGGPDPRPPHHATTTDPAGGGGGTQGNPGHPSPRPPSNATAALRKRQAESHDLYGSRWARGPEEDAFSAAESPMDTYASPQISPSTPGGGRGSGAAPGHPLPIQSFYAQHHQPHRGPVPHPQHPPPLHCHKSPSHFQTMDGRTVQSKNPFSPMIFDSEKLTPTVRFPVVPSASGGAPAALGLGHPLLLTTDSLSEDRRGTHLVPRHKLHKRGTNSPCHPPKAQPIRQGEPVGMGVSGLVPPPHAGPHAGDAPSSIEQKASLYTRNGYPERTGRYSFTGSPIKEGVAKPPALPPREPTTEAGFRANLHKVRRRSRGDDVVAAQGESSWKRTDMTVHTGTDPNHGSIGIYNSNNNSSNDNISNTHGYGFYSAHGSSGSGPEHKAFYYNQQPPNRLGLQNHPCDDNVSPTDVLSFPAHFRASPPDTSTVPPAPSKPARRPPLRKYTPIRRAPGPPRTPKPRMVRRFGEIGTGFGGDDSSDEGNGGGGANRHRSRHQGPETAVGDPRPPSRFHSDFDVIDELGSGSFGNVFKALSRLDGCMYAIKVAHRVAKGNSDRDRMLKEVYALSALSDQSDTATFHIVRYHQAWMEEQRLYIQTELCTTTLEAAMQEAAPGRLDTTTRFKCLREILLALEFIHGNKMVHLDIKPENIFLKNGLFKLGDFGLVSKVSSHDVEEGDSRYMSMELLSGDHKDLTKSDIFSLGIAVYEVCLGRTKALPPNGDEWRALRSGCIVPPPYTTNELFQIIKKMMNPTYQERPCATDLLKLPELLSEEQKLLFEEREKVLQANQALEAQSKKMTLLHPFPKPRGLVRRNTWSAF